jgi:heme/copper-type cytochrome/quinol oxidase subunit 2
VITELLANSAITMEWILTGIFIAFICFVMKVKRKTKILMTVIALIVAGATTYVLFKQNENRNPLNLPGCNVVESGKVERPDGLKDYVKLNCGGTIRYFETHN